MSSKYDQENGMQPVVREDLKLHAEALSGDLVINVITAVVTPAPTSSVWAYDVQFEIVNAVGKRHDWFNGVIAAAASDDSSAGTAAVDDATPAVVNGLGTVELSGDAADWLNTEVATLTLNGTIAGYTLANKTWTATFTTP